MDTTWTLNDIYKYLHNMGTSSKDAITAVYINLITSDITAPYY